MRMIKFDPKEIERMEAFLEELPDLEALAPQALGQYLAQTQQLIADLDALEPRSEKSDAYDRWAELHEDLEDVLDEILDLLED